MRIVQITDTHIYASAAARFAGMDTRASLCRVLDDIAARDAYDLLLVTGDVSMDESAASYAWIAPQLRRLATQVRVLPGNHDDPQQWPAAQAPGFVATPACYEHDGWRVLCLDSRVPGAPHGELSAHALAWLADMLATGDKSYDLIVLHHPPIACGSAWLDGMALRDPARLWAMLAQRPRVRAVICGHVHQNIDTWHAGVRVLSTPSTCIQFARNSARFALDRQNPGYRIIETAADGALTTRVIRVPLAGASA